VHRIINEERLGLNVIYIQAKRWEGTVMVPKVPFKGAIPLHTLISRANIVERVCCVSLDRPEEPTPQVVQLEGLATDAAVGTLTVKVRAYLSTYHLRAADRLAKDSESAENAFRGDPAPIRGWLPSPSRAP
jgi:hypothetical protein